MSEQRSVRVDRVKFCVAGMSSGENRRMPQALCEWRSRLI